MEEFLKTVARHYKRKSCSEAERRGEPASLPLSRLLFCFPNRRSGLFIVFLCTGGEQAEQTDGQTTEPPDEQNRQAEQTIQYYCMDGRTVIQ